jgi:hypothetical protein
VLGNLKVESIGKMGFCDNKQTNLNIVLSMDAYKMPSWEFCMVKTNPKTMGRNFATLLKLFKSIRLEKMEHYKMSNIGPKRSRVNESVWWTLM